MKKLSDLVIKKIKVVVARKSAIAYVVKKVWKFGLTLTTYCQGVAEKRGMTEGYAADWSCALGDGGDENGNEVFVA